MIKTDQKFMILMHIVFDKKRMNLVCPTLQLDRCPLWKKRKS